MANYSCKKFSPTTYLVTRVHSLQCIRGNCDDVRYISSHFTYLLYILADGQMMDDNRASSSIVT